MPRSIPATSLSFSGGAGAQNWNLPAVNNIPINVVSGTGAGFEAQTVQGGSCVGTGCSGTVGFKAAGVFMGPATALHLSTAQGATNNIFQTIQGVKVYNCSGC